MNNDQQATHQISHNQRDNEIDLVELCQGLWKEKITIFICIILSGLITVTYLLFSKPIYTVSIELTAPKESALSKIKPVISETHSNTFLYTPDAPLKQQHELLDLIQRNNSNNNKQSSPIISQQDAFSIFLSTLSSRSQVYNLLKSQPDILIRSFKIDIDNDGVINNINDSRTIEYPNTLRKNNELEPDSYFLTYNGYDREALKALITHDVNTASLSSIKTIKDFYMVQLNKKLEQHTNQQKADTSSIKNRIEARKQYLRAKYQANLTQIKEKISITKATKNNDTLTLLNAELKNLKQRGNNTFFDDELFAMQAQKQLIMNNPYIPQLTSNIKLLQNHSSDITFTNSIIVAPETPIKPKKAFIIALGAILGGFIGLIIALGQHLSKTPKKLECVN